VNGGNDVGTGTNTFLGRNFHGIVNSGYGLVTGFSTAQSVPEPASLALFVSGLGAMGLLKWRRKRKAQAV